MQTLNILTEYSSPWHVGVTVNRKFKFFTLTNKIFINEAEEINSVEIYFLGKNYKTDPDKFCQLVSIEYNKLILPELFTIARFDTDNPDCPVVNHCDYINMNGVWSIQLTKDTVKNILKSKVT